VEACSRNNRKARMVAFEINGFRITRGRMFFEYKKIQNLVPSVVNKKNIKMVLLDMKNQSTAHIIQH
jgi:hypothetical protein